MCSSLPPNLRQLRVPFGLEYARYHCELFPDSLLLRPKPQPSDPQRPLVDELKQTILHASGDILTSTTSLTPFDKDELTKLLELTTHLKENLEGSEPSLHAKAIVG
ncbi:hypothetical protein HYDPIDRAFT_109599, partial [Hydnomerulius pinastri MD-312]